MVTDRLVRSYSAKRLDPDNKGRIKQEALLAMAIVALNANDIFEGVRLQRVFGHPETSMCQKCHGAEPGETRRSRAHVGRPSGDGQGC